DPSHRSSLDLILGELDRLPDAEELWLELTTRLEGWRLDDDMGPRYERALQRFSGPGWWDRAARWYARRSRTQDLRPLAGDGAARFCGRRPSRGGQRREHPAGDPRAAPGGGALPPGAGGRLGGAEGAAGFPAQPSGAARSRDAAHPPGLAASGRAVLARERAA